MNENAHIFDETPPPYDLIGDVHGCIAELHELLDALGYVEDGGGVRHPDNRTLIFLGDLADRGPGGLDVWRLVLASLESGAARYVPGNHDGKLARYFEGRDVTISHGFEQTVSEFDALAKAKRDFLGDLIRHTVRSASPYLVLDEGRLVAVHAGLEEWMIGDVSHQVSVFARFGEKTGEFNALGIPLRRDWAHTYRGAPLIVYAHTPTPEPIFRNNTINIDQGCAFGGRLTALCYPELKTVSVRAQHVYARPSMAEQVALLVDGALAADD